MICFPLDNTPCDAADMGAYLATRTRGVYSADDNLAVTAVDSSMAVNVAAGIAWLKWSEFWGTVALQEQPLVLNLDAADGVLSRIDTIVCRLNKIDNKSEIVVKKGAAASTPTIVDAVRNDNFDEIYLASVLINAGAVAITAADITDLRTNEQYCGVMRDGVTGIPTEQLTEQVTALITQLQQALNGVLDGSAYMLQSAYGGSAPGVVATADEAINAMPKAGGTFSGAVAAAETATQTRRMLNTEVRSGSTTGELQNVVYFVDVV